MKNWKKKASIQKWLLILVAGVLFLSACGTDGSTTQVETPGEGTNVVASETPEPTATPAVTPTQAVPVHLLVNEDDLAGVAVRFAHPWAGELAGVLEAAAMQFSLSNPWDIWVDVEAAGSDMALQDQLQADLISGEMPGLIATYPYVLDALEGNYFSVNLTDYFYDPDWGFSEEERGDIPEVFLEQFTLEDHLAALPLAPQPVVLFYNQSWAEELGYAEMPFDEATFMAQSCAATRYNNEDVAIENNGTGGWLVNLDPQVLASWYTAFGGVIPTDATPQFDNEAGQAAFGFLKTAFIEKTIYYEGCIWISLEPYPYSYFANRYALMAAGTLDQLPSLQGWMDTAGNEDQWSVMGFPGPEGPVMLVDGPGLVVTADTPENQMAAWLFARYLLSPEVQADLARAGFSLPVRQSALNDLGDFAAAYPQWEQAISLIGIAQPVPTSLGWGEGQWLLQDAVNRILQAEADQLPMILSELDAMLVEQVGD